MCVNFAQLIAIGHLFCIYWHTELWLVLSYTAATKQDACWMSWQRLRHFIKTEAKPPRSRSHTHFLSIPASQALLFPSANAIIVTCDVLQTHPMELSACSRSSVCRIFCGGVKAPLKWDKTELQNWRNVSNCIFLLPLRYPAYIPSFPQTKLLQRSSLRTRRISSAT